MARTANSSNFSKVDTLALAKLFAALGPIGNDDWENLADHFNKRRGYTRPQRTKDSLKKKWKSIRNMEKPTGRASPNSLANHVRQAEENIKEKICLEEVAGEEDTEYEDDEEMEHYGNIFNDIDLDLDITQ
ncbi:hypothetical protein MBANPS3_012423 [Mucor bainieri]